MGVWEVVDVAQAMLYGSSLGDPEAIIRPVQLEGTDAVCSTLVAELISIVMTGSLDFPVLVAEGDAVINDVSGALVGAAVERITEGSEDDGSGALGSVVLEATHVPRRHWLICWLSTKPPFCFEGVRLRRYEVSKLPAPQPTRPMKTSEFWLMSVFWAQNAVKHYIKGY